MSCEVKIRKYSDFDVKYMAEIWNEVVTEGIAFPQEECLTDDTAAAFFSGQSLCSVS